jgi:hypothetical protein
MVYLIVNADDIVTKHKIVHMELDVLIHVLRKLFMDKVRGMMSARDIALELCFYGIVRVGNTTFQLEGV